MKNHRLELIVGAFVLIGLGAIAFLSIKIAGGTLFGKNNYLVTARFNSVSGLNPGSNVVIAGVPVGRVESIRLDPERFDAIVNLRINSDIKLSSESTASIKTSGLIGDRYILIQPGADDTMITTDGKGRISETNSPVDIEDLISRFAFGSLDKKDETKTPSTE